MVEMNANVARKAGTGSAAASGSPFVAIGIRGARAIEPNGPAIAKSAVSIHEVRAAAQAAFQGMEKGAMGVGKFTDAVKEITKMASESTPWNKGTIMRIMAEEIRRPIARMVGKTEGSRAFYDVVNDAITTLVEGGIKEAKES